MSIKGWFSLQDEGPVVTRIFLIVAASLSLMAAKYVPASALTSLSQGYTTSDKLSVGSIVSLKASTSDQVVAATTGNADSLLGVVIGENGSLLSLSTGSDNQVQVASSGTVPVLVSDINGTVERGDHITASPISGVGMKATGNIRVIGIAEGNMERSSKQTYTDKAGSKKSVTIGQVPLMVNVAYYFKQPEKTIVPTALQNVANALAGKTVSTTPILISAAIFFVMLIVVSSMVYSMIKSSIISVGRNPMAQSAVYRNVLQMSTIILVIVAAGFASIYLILTKV